MQSNLIQRVDNISPDELSLGLVESVQTPPGRGRRRFQMIQVIRNSRPAEWIYDLGPAENFHAHAFNIPSGQVYPNGDIEAWHTVGELRDIADNLRESKKDDPFPNEPTRDWEQGFHEEADIRRRVAQKVSAFGPIYRKMRY